MLKEKEIEVSVEIVLKKIEGYVIKNYLYLINVEVSGSINFNFNRQSTDKLPRDYQQSADMLPTVGCLSTDRSLKLWKELSADCWPTVGRQLVNSRPTAGRVEVSCSSQLPTELWKQKKLVNHSPQGLIQTVWWLLTQHFGLCGHQEHHNMQMNEPPLKSLQTTTPER